MHAGHRELTVDLETTGGRHTLAELVESADVVIEASRPRAMRRLGIDAAAHVSEGAVWVSITAYGRSIDATGFGDDVAAGAGLVRDGEIPCGDALADPLTGCVAAAAAVAAMQGNTGVLLDVSMHDVAADAAGAVPDHAVTRVGQHWWAEDATGRHLVRAPRIGVPSDGRS